jgi:vacuolar protein sorting-associated protein VTA1
MPALAVPPELKKIAPYIRRAEELDKDKSSAESRLVSYYLRQYAVHLGIPLAKSSSAAAKTCLGHILGALEAEKAAMDNFTKDEAAFLCRKFANKVFDKADEEDRMGIANKETAKTFYAAASFLTILEQFYAPSTTTNDGSNVNSEMEEDKKRILYAKWKATDILKAIKEGRSPTPGGYGEEEEEYKKQQQQQDADNDAYDDGTSEKKQDAPTFETVQHDDDSDEDTGFIPLPPPSLPPPGSLMEPVAPPVADDNDGENVVDHDDEGTEVQFGQGPPPAYPGGSHKTDSGSSAPGTITTATTRPGHSSVDHRPHVTFDVPSPILPPPVVPKQTPAPAPAPVSPKPKKTNTSGVGSIFGFGKGNMSNNKNKATKAELADALELTRFALAALEDKDADVAAERLQQALRALGR